MYRHRQLPDNGVWLSDVSTGDSGGPVFDSGNVLVGIHNAGYCASNPIGPTVSDYLPVTTVVNWIESTANTKCALSWPFPHCPAVTGRLGNAPQPQKERF